MVCRDFILPEPASYVVFYAISNLRKLLYIIAISRMRFVPRPGPQAEQRSGAHQPVGVG